jgi:Rrf2 family protein
MPQDADSRAADLEARNQYLGMVDDAWEVYREAVERAWNTYEKALEPPRAAYEAAQASAEESHGKAIDEAWGIYKAAVANAPSTMRRDIVAQARASYNEAAAQVRKQYNESMSIAREEYLHSVGDLRSAYRAAVEGELDAHREAVRKSWGSYLELVDSRLHIDNARVHISAKVDYACRALCALAASAGDAVTAEALAEVQNLPVRFLRSILNELRRDGLVVSQRGNEGGYRLARPASEITLGEIFRRLEGPLAEVRNERPQHASYTGAAEHLQEVWVAVRAALREVLDQVSLADVLSGELPVEVSALVSHPDAWHSR